MAGRAAFSGGRLSSRDSYPLEESELAGGGSEPRAISNSGQSGVWGGAGRGDADAAPVETDGKFPAAGGVSRGPALGHCVWVSFMP
jgi:hypothetical protein